MHLDTKLPKVGTTIFTLMSALAVKHDAVNLGQGFPDFDGPPALREALVRHLERGCNQYAPMPGVMTLREQIAIKCERLYGRKVDADTEVTVTSGGTEALFAAIAAVVRAGDEVIVLDPCYDSYEPAIELQGARAVHVPLRDGLFTVDWDRVRDAVTPRTRMIVVNSPHNPSGAVFDAADLDALSDITRDSGIFVLSDEVYEHIVFDGHEHQSVLRRPDLAERSFVVNSFGKVYHVTGWKIGFCVAPTKLSAEFRKVHQYLTFCSFNAAQWAFADMLEQAPEHYLELPSFYQKKRDFFRALLAETRFRLLPVSGAYFQLVDYGAISQEDDQDFCRRLVEQRGVAAIPVSSFYETPPRQTVIRFCFAKREETLQKAAERLRGI